MKIYPSCIIPVVCGIALSSCVRTTVSKSDPRFTSIFGKDIETKRPLRLYRLDYNLTGDADHHLITAGHYQLTETDSGEIGVLPAGHKVRFNEIHRVHSGDGVSESLRGTTVFHGVSYPVTYWLGFAHDTGPAGWQRIYRSFKMPKQE